MEWLPRAHLALPAQPHYAAFHPSHPLLAAAVGRHLVEFDVLTGCKLSAIDMGGVVVHVAYSPAGGHVLVAILDDWTIRAWDVDAELVSLLYAPPDKRTEKLAVGSLEVHIALTPLRPLLFFGAYRRTSVSVVGIGDGVRPSMRIKTDIKKPVTGLACHPRQPILYVAYAEGVIRAYNILSFAVLYTLAAEPTVKLLGAGAIAFHATLDHIFVGDRGGAILAWDVSVQSRPNLVGLTMASTTPLVQVAWHSSLQLLLSLTRDGAVKAWRVRIFQNPNHPVQRSNFLEPAGVGALDISYVYARGGRQLPHPAPVLRGLFVHPRLNALTVLLAKDTEEDQEVKKKLVNMSYESRKHLLAVLQSARGSPDGVMREKLAALGAAGLSEQNLQQQLILSRGQSKIMQPTLVDLARKVGLHGAMRDTASEAGPLHGLPLLTIADVSFPLRDAPVCQPFHQHLAFFNSKQPIFQYPSRAIFMDGCNLLAYSLVTGDYYLMKKLSPAAMSGGERLARHIVHSPLQSAWLIFFECRGTPSEVVLYRAIDSASTTSDTVTTFSGRDGCWTGHHDNHYAILEEDGFGLTLYPLENAVVPPALDVAQVAHKPVETDGALDASIFSDASAFSANTFDRQAGLVAPLQEPAQLTFETPVQRIFCTPLEYVIAYVIVGSHMGLAYVNPDVHDGGSVDFVDSNQSGATLVTRPDLSRSLKLSPLEAVLQVEWQETATGFVAGIITTLRVLIVDSNLQILSSTSTTYDCDSPAFLSLVWSGPALLFSTSTVVAMLGWDNVAHPLLTLDSPSSVILGVLNDRVLLASPGEGQRQNAVGTVYVDVRMRLLGLLEPLLVGWVTMLNIMDPHVDLAEVLYQLTSRFDSVRISPRVLNVLSKGPPICASLAVELAQSGPQFPPELRCSYASKARQFTAALAILRDEFLRSKDYPKCPRTSRLFQQFRELGRTCIMHGQFDLAKEAYEMAGDYESQLDLYLAHLNPSSLRRLSQKLDETPSVASGDLKRQVERVLLVRSAGWSKGGAFTSAQGESMAPREASWAGGNWTLTTTNAVDDPKKPRPKWGLAAEVTAYMKAPGGAIPVVDADSLGVYLGTQKGRGSVLEVPEMLPEGAASGTGLLLGGPAASGPSMTRSSSTSSSIRADKAFGALGVMTAFQDAGDDTESEAQSQAAADFKSGMLSIGDMSSSDDESTGGSTPSSRKRAIKVRIRDKPVGAGLGKEAVDVNKVKEATRQFTLGEIPRSGRLVPAMETQAATGSVGLGGQIDASGSGQPLGTFTPPPLFFGSPAPVPAQVSDYSGQASQLPPQSPPRAQALQYLYPPFPSTYPSPSQPNVTSPAVSQIAPGLVYMQQPPQPAPSGQFQPAYRPSYVGPVGSDMLQQVPSNQAPVSYVQQTYPVLQDGSLGFAPSTFGPPPPATLGLPPPGGSLQLPAPPPSQQGPELDGNTELAMLAGIPPQALLPSVASSDVPESSSAVADTASASASTSGAVLQGLLEASSGKSEQVKVPEVSTDNVKPGQVPSGQSAAVAFKTGLVHIEENRLRDALRCFDESFLALAKDRSTGKDVSSQAEICAHYKVAVLLLQEIAGLEKGEGQGTVVGAKEEQARLARHLASLPLQARHRISCVRTAIKRNMEVQNYAYAKRSLDLLLSKAPAAKQAELKALVNVCVQRGLANRTISGQENPSSFCHFTLGRLPTIGHDKCNTCHSKFPPCNHPAVLYVAWAQWLELMHPPLVATLLHHSEPMAAVNSLAI